MTDENLEEIIESTTPVRTKQGNRFLSKLGSYSASVAAGGLVAYAALGITDLSRFNQDSLTFEYNPVVATGIIASACLAGVGLKAALPSLGKMAAQMGRMACKTFKSRLSRVGALAVFLGALGSNHLARTYDFPNRPLIDPIDVATQAFNSLWQDNPIRSRNAHFLTHYATSLGFPHPPDDARKLSKWSQRRTPHGDWSFVGTVGSSSVYKFTNLTHACCAEGDVLYSLNGELLMQSDRAMKSHPGLEGVACRIYYFDDQLYEQVNTRTQNGQSWITRIKRAGDAHLLFGTPLEFVQCGGNAVLAQKNKELALIYARHDPNNNDHAFFRRLRSGKEDEITREQAQEYGIY